MILLASLVPAVSVASEPSLEETVKPYDVVVLFNSGGLGKTPVEESRDFASVLDGINQSISDQGYSTKTIGFARTEPGIRGFFSDIKEELDGFKDSSQREADDIQALLNKYPNKYFVVLGYSNGGGIAARTVFHLRSEARVMGITAGVPGWYRNFHPANLLDLDNSGTDTIAVSDYKAVVWAVIKSPWVWLKSHLDTKPVSLALAIEIPGHHYDWSSPEVGPAVSQFLKARLGHKK